MSQAEKSPGETPTEPTPPPTGLGILFLAAALALGLVLSFVALIAYMAFSPSRTVNPPSVPSSKPAHEGRLLPAALPGVRRT
jgi:hypothetical protein